MKSRSEIWLCALEELSAQCSVSTQRDAETLAKRVAREGDSFFTVTLPKYGKDFELALAMRRIPRDLFKGFARSKLNIDFIDEQYGWCVSSTKMAGGTPKFLGGFMDLLFNTTIETNYDEFEFVSNNSTMSAVTLVPQLRAFAPDEVIRAADVVAAIRQLCLMFAKEKASAPPKAIERAYDQFVQTDEELDSPLGIVEEISFSKEDSSTKSEGLSESCSEKHSPK
jgi:hypothetical protein